MKYLKNIKSIYTTALGAAMMAVTSVMIYLDKLDWIYEGLVGIGVGFALLWIPDDLIGIMKRWLETKIPKDK